MLINKDVESVRDESTAKRRRLIVESAAECFIEKGFHQTSVRDIAAKAKISLGNLYNHFESKAALIAEIAALEAEEMAEIEEKLQREEPAANIIDSFVQSYFDYVTQPTNTLLSAEIYVEALRNEDVAKEFELNRDRLVSLLSAVLKKGQSENNFKLEGKPVEIANLIIDLVEGAAMRVAFNAKQQKLKTKKTLVEVLRKLTVT